MSRMFLWCTVFLFSSVLALATAVSGDNVKQPTTQETKETGAKDSAPADESEPLPADPAFAKYVDLDELPQALSQGNAELITDLALQLAEGERILQRSRKGLAAQQLMRLAARMAGDTKDHASLERLGKAATARKDAELGLQVETALKLAKSSRKAGAPLTFTEEEIELGAYDAYKETLRGLARARAVGDRATLEALAKGIGTGADLGANASERLKSEIDEALKTLPDKDSPEAELAAKLLAAARSSDDDGKVNKPVEVSGSFLTSNGLPPSKRSSIWERISPDLVKHCYINLRPLDINGRRSTLDMYTIPNSLPKNHNLWEFCNSRWGNRVSNGECGELNRLALLNIYNGRAFDFAGKKPLQHDDYIWGNLVGQITPHNYVTTLKKIYPGDLLQFRNLRMANSVTYNRRPSAYGGKADHHSAIVAAVGSDFINVFEQNVNGRLWVQQGLYYFPAMTGGTIWVYRAR